VLNFYRAYRAFVRGKVHSIEATEPEVPAPQRRAAFASARRCFALALSYARPARPRVVVMCGLSGTGKSYVASALAGRIGAPVVSSDLVRKELLGVGPMAAVTEDYGRGVYTPEQRARVYEALRERAARYLDDGLPVVLDATHEHRADRDAARSLARAHGVPAALVHVTAAEPAVRERLEARSTGDAVSGARWGTYLEQRRRFEPVAADEGAIETPSGVAFDRALDAVVEALGA
jgi:predicted kinase